MNTFNREDSHPQKITDLPTLVSQTVDAIEHISGVHLGYRRAHAKGVCCRAIFRPNGVAATFTCAPHLQVQEVNAIVRFSGSSTDPAMADFLSPAKGIGVQFILPNDDVMNLVGATIPVFFARTPESFLDIIQAVHRAQEGELGPLDLFQEITTHFSESKESLLAVKHLMPPASYADCHYYCIHAYYFINRNNHAIPVKFEWVPAGGVRTLSIIDASQKPNDYLEEELHMRLKDGPTVLQLVAIFGEPEDPTSDPTIAWPEERKQMVIGALYISEIIDEPENLVMDPTVISAGMALSDDPILNFRHATYVESHHRRHQEKL